MRVREWAIMKKHMISPIQVTNHIRELIGENEHEKRVKSIANSVVGLLHSAELSVQAIGLGLAQAKDLNGKHTTKQVDRLMSNEQFDVESRCADWVSYLLRGREDIIVALDWTDYDADGQSTISLGLVEGHGRATPLMWRSVEKSTLKGNRNRYEDALLTRFHECVPEGLRVTVTADRGFADQCLAAYLNTLGFDYIIRIRKDTTVYDTDNNGRAACKWLRGNGRLFRMNDIALTQDHTPVPVFVSVKQKDMKDAWFLISSRSDWTGTQIIKAYGKRFTIEEMFRDDKDPRFGMGLSQTRISKPKRRDRMLFVAALARDLISLLGKAGESIGLDRKMKANTSYKRTHSFFTQGKHYFLCLPNMSAAPRRQLMKAFNDVLTQSRFHDYVNQPFAFEKMRG